MQTRTSSRIIFLVLSAWIARTAVFALSFSSSKLQNWFCKGFNSREGLFRVSFPKRNTDHQTNNRWRSTSILIFVILVSLVGVLKIEDSSKTVLHDRQFWLSVLSTSIYRMVVFQPKYYRSSWLSNLKIDSVKKKRIERE